MRSGVTQGAGNTADGSVAAAASFTKFWHAPAPAPTPAPTPTRSSAPSAPSTPSALAASDDDVPAARVLPDAAMDLVFSGGALRIAGADTSVKFATIRPDTGTWGVRLAPGLAHALLRVAAAELTDRRANVDEIVQLPSQVRDSLAQDPAAGMRLAVSELWRRSSPDPLQLLLAASIDRAARSGRGVREIAFHHNLSERSLRRFADRTFGYGVKTLASIHRFQRALQLSSRGYAAAEVAMHAGYADQAHLIRETRKYAGVTFRSLTHHA